ncbi:hypothetical protein AgCh_012939 [Apium graveolens]
MWHKARKGKLDDEEVDPELAEIGKRIENLLELQSKGEFIPSGSQDVLTTALQTPEHSGRVRGVGGFVSPSIFFNLPNGKRSRITKAELLARDCERDAELEKAKQEMAKEMEKTRQELAELKGLLSKANISSPLVSEKASCDAQIVDDQMDPFPPENKAGPRKCELAVGTIEDKVAFGLLFDDDDMNKSIHGLSMQPGCARVSVDGPIQGQAKIPVPVVGEIETVEQAVGSYVSWPRDLIIFPDAPATAKSKRKGKDPLTDLHKVQSLFENMEINKNVPKRFRLLYKHATTFMKSTGNSIQIPCDAEVFGVEKRIFILHENIIALLEFKMIGQAAISAYMAYLHCMVCENENLEQFAFCDPGVSFTLNNNFEDNLVSRFKEGNPDRLFFMPHNSKAVIAFNIQAGRGNKAPTIRYVTGCPKQPGGTECGYVVMWYMKEIAMDNEMTFIKKWSKKNRKVTVAKAELDEVSEVISTVSTLPTSTISLPSSVAVASVSMTRQMPTQATKTKVSKPKTKKAPSGVSKKMPVVKSTKHKEGSVKVGKKGEGQGENQGIPKDKDDKRGRDTSSPQTYTRKKKSKTLGDAQGTHTVQTGAKDPFTAPSQCQIDVAPTNVESQPKYVKIETPQTPNSPTQSLNVDMIQTSQPYSPSLTLLDKPKIYASEHHLLDDLLAHLPFLSETVETSVPKFSSICTESTIVSTPNSFISTHSMDVVHPSSSDCIPTDVPNSSHPSDCQITTPMDISHPPGVSAQLHSSTIVTFSFI